MPCFELFEAQDAAYRDEVLPPKITARVAVEAGASFGWDRYIGPKGKTLSVDRFGASAPGGELLERFGFTPDKIVEAVKSIA